MTAPQNTTRLAVITGLALAGVIGIGAVVGSDSVADDLTPKAYEALAAKGLGGVSVDFDGREARLSNGTPEELAAADVIVERIEGVRWAYIRSDADAGKPLPKPPTLSFSRSDDGVNLSGVVPNAEVATQLKDAAAASFGTVTGDFKVDPNVGTADWLVTMPKLIPNVASVNDLALSVDGDSISLGGSLPSQPEIDAVVALVEPALGDLSLDNTLKVGAAVLNAQQAADLEAANVYFARGSSVLDDTAKASLETVVDVLLRVPGVELEIGGHAGPTDPVRGKILSGERVAAVRDYLLAAGIDSARLSTKSYGSDPQTGGDGFAEKYRRVDFIVKEN